MKSKELQKRRRPSMLHQWKTKYMRFSKTLEDLRLCNRELRWRKTTTVCYSSVTRLCQIKAHESTWALGFPLRVSLTSAGQRILHSAFICKEARVCFPQANATEGDNPNFQSITSLPKPPDKFHPITFYHVLNGWEKNLSSPASEWSCSCVKGLLLLFCKQR